MGDGGKTKAVIFEEASARILAEVYASHPDPLHIAVTQTFSGLTQEEAISYANTIDWLGKEGFLRISSVGGSPQDRHFSKVTLTLFGLTVLGQVPKALQAPGSRPTTLGQELLAAVRAQTIDAAVGLAREAMVQAGALALRGIVGP